MPLVFKFDVLQSLKNNGYNTSRLRKEKILAESTIQKLRGSQPIGWANLEQICELLNCQPGDLLQYVPEEETAPAEEDTKEAEE